MSPYFYDDWGYGLRETIFIVQGSDYSGQLGWAGVEHANGVVRPKFLFDKFFNNYILVEKL